MMIDALPRLDIDTLDLDPNAEAFDVTLHDGVTRTIRLDRTPCQFGGYRPWFLCPRCGARRGVLVVFGDVLGCRGCLNLGYASEYVPDTDSAAIRLQEFERRYPGEKKPKRMWWRTWERILEKWDCLRAKDNAAISRRLVVDFSR